MANKIANEQNYVTNPQFTGGVNLSGTGAIGFIAGGLYVGTFGNVTATTVDGSQLVFKNISGFIPGLFVSVDAGTTAADIVAFR